MMVWLILALGIAIGLSSEAFFVGLMAGHPAVALFVAAAIFLAALYLAIRRSPRTRDAASERGLACAFGLLLLADLAVFVWASIRTPRGNWDAWAIWNLRAHFLYREGGAAWRDGFTDLLDWSHPDYPLLLPAFIAGAWKLLGRESRAVPVALACFFTFGSAALMAASVAMLRGVRQGLLAGIALAATPVFFIQGAMQCADVPVAFFRLATLAAMALADRSDSRGLAMVAGASAALDAWAKNEGLLWFGAFLIALVLMGRGRLTVGFVAGALPVLAPIVLFKARVATASDIFGAAGRVGMMARALDPARYSLIASEGLKHVWSFGPLLVSPFALLGIYLAVTGLRPGNRDRMVVRAGVLALILTSVGYCAIYLLRTLDLKWLLDTSSDRLLLQVWPAVVFLVMLAARAPDPSRDL
jgi:hypothetical protein